MRTMLARLTRTAVVLGASCVVAAVAFTAGRWSTPEVEPPPPTPTPVEAGPEDAGARDAGLDAATVPADAGPIDAGAPPPRADRWIVCPEPTFAPSMVAAQLVGDSRPELIIGCGDHWEVLVVREGVPVRVARIDAPPVEIDTSPGTGPALIADANADGTPDLVLPFMRRAQGGAAQGGGVFIVSRDRFGGLSAPRALAPTAAPAAVSGALDGDELADLVVIHQANPLAQWPSELWVFGGGAMPTRRAVLRTAAGAHALTLADLDRDRALDIVVSSDEESRVEVFFGDGQSAFPIHPSVAVPHPGSIVVGDLDGDGQGDVLVEGETLVWLHVDADRTLSAVPIAVERPLRGVQLLDLDGDGRAEIVGWDHPRLVALSWREGRVDTRVLLELGPGEFGPRRQWLADLGGTDGPMAALLGVSDIPGARSLEFVLVPSTRSQGAPPTVVVGERRDLQGAPLELRIPLPDAQGQAR